MANFTGTSGADEINGGIEDDTINGLGGHDILTGGDGNDTVNGGTGNDSISGGNGDDALNGEAGNDVIHGDAGIDAIRDSAGGDDRLFGGEGRDQILVDRGGSVPASSIWVDGGIEGAYFQFLASGRYIDTVTYLGGGAATKGDVIYMEGGGTVTIDTGAFTDQVGIFEIGTNVHVTMGEHQDRMLIVPESFNNGFTGGLVTVADLEPGAAGDRIFVLDSPDPVQLVQQGADVLFEYDADGDGPGGFGSFLLVKNAQVANIHYDSASQYYYHSIPAAAASESANSLVGTDAANAINGLGGADVIYGLSGNDTINGGTGADRMIGGGGDDLFHVDNSADVVFENSRQGSDTVRSNISYTLADHVENLVLTGGADLNGNGSAQANMLTGNGGSNRLNGRGGADVMTGGLGHDVYVVDHAGDQVIEAGSGGTDTVQSSVSFNLPTHVEKLILTGSFGVDGRGNSAANTITGNGGGNFLSGGSGNDVIDAGAGNDRILGGAGNDSLKGGAGLDRFEFTTALGATNVDKILDYSVANDTIYLLRSVFTRAGANGALASGAFHQGSAAADAADRIVYDQATGKVYYDSDGNGAAAAIQFATVTAGTALTSADFMIYG